MGTERKNSKPDKYFKVAHAILEIIGNEGIHSISHSKISRKAKISRAWIYQYIGTEKEDLLEVALNIMGDYFSRSDTSPQIKNKNELLKLLIDAADFVFESAIIEPMIIVLYYRFRGTPTAIGRA